MFVSRGFRDCLILFQNMNRISFALVSTAMKANTVCILVKSKKCFKTLKLRLISTNDANEVSDLCCLLTDFLLCHEG